MGGMKTDLYTKIVLTIIGACLLALVFRNAPTITTAYAETGTVGSPTHVIIDGVRENVGLPVINYIDEYHQVALLRTHVQ
jgi:hypothetical protein